MNSFPSDGTAERLDRLEQEIGRLKQENGALAERLERVRRGSRDWRIAVAFLILAAAFMGQPWRAFVSGTPKLVEAEQFSLRDSRGNQRVILEVTPGGYPRLAFYDDKKRTRLQIGAGYDAAGMSIYDVDSLKRADIGFDKTGWAGFSARDRGGKLRYRNGLASNNTAGMSIHDTSGKERLTMGGSDGGPMDLSIFDVDGRKRARIGLATNDWAGLSVYDQGGKARLESGLGRNDEPGMSVFDPSGKARLVIGGTAGGKMGVQIFGVNGHIRTYVGLSKSDWSGLGVWDQNVKMRIDNSVRPDGLARLAVYDSDGTPTFQGPEP